MSFALLAQIQFEPSTVPYTCKRRAPSSYIYIVIHLSAATCKVHSLFFVIYLGKMIIICKLFYLLLLYNHLLWFGEINK